MTQLVEHSSECVGLSSTFGITKIFFLKECIFMNVQKLNTNFVTISVKFYMNGHSKIG
jgi:hypothetical protein